MRWLSLIAALAALPVRAEQIGPDDLRTLPPADVIFLGEVHDNPVHHQHQAKAVAAIEPAALVFEMLSAEQAARIPLQLPGADELERLLQWHAAGWPDFDLYYPIFATAPEAHIYGAALPRDQARAAMASNLAAHFAGDAARFGLDQPLGRDQQARRETLQDDAHCNALPAEMLPGMVAIQRLRDAMLAEAALRAVEQTGGPVVVITGTGHTRTDWGAPAALAQAAPDLRILSIGQYEIAVDGDAPNDLWLVTDPHPRADPCDAFR